MLLDGQRCRGWSWTKHSCRDRKRYVDKVVMTTNGLSLTKQHFLAKFGEQVDKLVLKPERQTDRFQESQIIGIIHETLFYLTSIQYERLSFDYMNRPPICSPLSIWKVDNHIDLFLHKAVSILMAFLWVRSRKIGYIRDSSFVIDLNLKVASLQLGTQCFYT